MEKEIADWLAKIKNCKEKSEIKTVTDSFDLSALMQNNQNAVNEILKIVNEQIKQFPLDKMPFVLDALYQTQNKDKFYLFCHLLEKTYTNLPTLTNLEKYPIHREKFKVFFHAYITME